MVRLVYHCVKPMETWCYTSAVEISAVFAQNLLRFRKAKGLSQRELGSMIGLSHRMISYYEGKPGSIPINKLDQLAEALEVNVVNFFSTDDQPSLKHLDVRWLKKMNELRQLPEAEQKEIARHITSTFEKVRLRQQLEELSQASS
jgi:transcriptional regulator with XRE-family HTH domain